MAPVNIDARIAGLQDRLVSLGDGGHCRSDNEKAEWWSDHTTTSRTLSGLRNAPADLARYEQQLRDLADRRAIVVARQTELEHAIADAPDVTTTRDRREQDRELERQQHLQQQLVRLHDGTLLRAPGVVYDRISDLDARIADLRARRDRTQQALDSYVQVADTLLGEATDVPERVAS